jgi:hypothetical protein
VIRAALGAVALSACASALPARLAEPSRPDPPPRLATAADVADARAALSRACPAPTADDPTPGLSFGARTLGAGSRRWCQGLPLTQLAALERLLGGTSRNSPDRPKILARMAVIWFSLEHDAHEDCRASSAAPEPPAERRAAFVEEARRTVRVLYAFRGSGAGTCEQLVREHPDAVPAICWSTN